MTILSRSLHVKAPLSTAWPYLSIAPDTLCTKVEPTGLSMFHCLSEYEVCLRLNWGILRAFSFHSDIIIQEGSEALLNNKCKASLIAV